MLRKNVALIAAIALLLFFAGVASSVSLAQQMHPVFGLPHPMRTASPPPLPAPNLQNAKLALPSARVFRAGRRVPLVSFPPLPPKTPANTAYFPPGARGPIRRPMAANGATLNFFADFGNASCGSIVGTLIPVGCDVFFQSTNLPGTDTWDDFFIPAGSQTAIESSGGTYTGATGPLDGTPNMNSVGTYVLATFDVTANKWEDVVYLTVGNVNVFATFADSAATIPQQQFTAATGTNVYINASGLTQGQSYVVYVESTSGNLFCEYIAPPPSTATPNPNGFCDPTTSAGITALVGAQASASITAVWPLSNSTPTGTYSVVLYNLTTNQRLAQRQVSITQTGSTGSMTLAPPAGNAALPANWPTPPPAPGASTIFPFDSTTERSDSGWTMTASGLTRVQNYTFTVTDPTGAVVAGPTTVRSSNAGIGLGNFTFTNAQSPGNYIGNTYTVQMLNQSTNKVDASQAFQILGYHATTLFQSITTLADSTAAVLPQGSSVTDNLLFTNDGDTLYGTGNGDTISEIAFNTGATGISTTLTGGGVTSCGATCQQETVADSNGQDWTVQNTCFGGGANKGCTITLFPAVAGEVLAINGSITIPAVQFNNVPGNSGCQNGCNGLTAILPTHGASWSKNNNNQSTNTVFFTNAAGNTFAGTMSVTHTGYIDNTNTFHANQETHGYSNNETNATYTAQSPFAPTSGFADVFSFTAVNNSSAGSGNLKEIEIILPTAFTPSGTTTNFGVVNGGTGNWATAGCPPAAPTTAICVRSATGINPAGGTDTFTVFFTPPPPGAFSFTDWGFQAIMPTQFPLTASGTFTGFVPSTNTYDTTATAAYSLNANLITPAFSPTSAGQNTNNGMTINVTNASTAQDPFPDYLDAIVIDLPASNAFTGAAGMPAGWSLLGTSAPSAGTTRYWFGLCAAQFNTADGPVTNPPPVNPSLPSCGTPTEDSSIAPGKTFTVNGSLQTGTSSITGTMYAHGANGGGWSEGHSFSLNVTAVAAAAGFSAAGGFPTANAVVSPNTPQIGADSDTTSGNAYSYVITNTSGAGQNITSAVITIPGLDVSSVLPADGTAWTLTNTPSISGSAFGCSVTSSASANRTGANNGYGPNNGGITIGGSSCSIPPGSSITVTFNAKAPYTVNDSYQFPTKVNGTISAAEKWQTDTFVQIILSASLVIAVDPGNPGPGGSAPVVNCASCAFDTTTNTVDFGSIANGSTVTGSDIVRVSVFTNAGTTNPWQLFVSTNSNPANTGSPTNELLTSIDSARSAPTTGINFDQTSFAVVPTAGSLKLMDTGTGHAATRTPFDEIMNFEISIQGGSTAGQTSTVTYTFIAN